MNPLNSDQAQIIEFMILITKFLVFGIALAISYAWVKYSQDP